MQLPDRVFPQGDVYFITDDEWLGLAATYYGARHIPVRDIGGIPSAANIILFLCDQPVTPALRDALCDMRVVYMSLAGYDSSLISALYTQRLVLMTDLSAVAARYRSLQRMLAAACPPLSLNNFSGVTITFSDDLAHPGDAPESPLRGVPVAAGQFVDIAACCQVPLAPRQPATGSRLFRVTGSTTAVAVLVRDGGDSGSEGRGQASVTGHQVLTAHCPISVTFRDGVVTRITGVAGKDMRDAVRENAGCRGDLLVRQAGIGVNGGIRPIANWRINSPMHVGAATTYLAVGAQDTDREVVFILAPRVGGSI